MKIAILGAPGAGKSKLARRIVNRFPDEKWGIIDGYVDKLSKRTGLEYGHFASYEQNLQVMTERWTLEAEAAHKGWPHTITCGSIYETIIYCALHSQFSPIVDVDAELRESIYGRSIMHALGAIENATTNYDIMFYLPWDESHVKKEEHSWDNVLNLKIPEVLDGQLKYAIVLNNTSRATVDKVYELIQGFREFEATASDDQPTI